MSIVDFARFETQATALRETFASAQPYPHVVIDDFLPQAAADDVLAEFRQTIDGWNHYRHYNESKQALTAIPRMGPTTQAVFGDLQSERFVGLIGKLTGLDRLISDPDLDGAGLHEIKRGGFLNVHTDFLSHTKNRHWSRQINLLLYFNKNWRAEWNGELELWDGAMQRCERSIAPILNRCVIFLTREKSFHGHPAKLACPPDESRKSIALYYFRNETAAQKLAPTHYRARPNDTPVERALIAADRGLVRGYSFLKRYTKLSDRVLSRFIKPKQ